MSTLNQEIAYLADALGTPVGPARAGEPTFLPYHHATRIALEAQGPLGPCELGNVYISAIDELLGTIPIPLAKARLHGQAPAPTVSTRLTVPPPSGPHVQLDEVAGAMNDIFESFVVNDQRRLLATVASHLEASVATDPRALGNLITILCRLQRREKAAEVLDRVGRGFHDRDDRDAVSQVLRICEAHFPNEPWAITLRHDLTRGGEMIYHLVNIFPFDVLPIELTEAAEKRFPPILCKGTRPLIASGAAGSDLVIVKSGYLKILLRPGDLPVRLRFAGDVVGEARLLAAWRARQGQSAAVVPSTAHVEPAEGAEVWVLPEAEIFAWEKDPSFPDFLSGLQRLSERRALDSHLASARWARERFGCRPSQKDRNQIIESAGPTLHYPREDMEVIAAGEPATSILLVTKGGLEIREEGRVPENLEPGDPWGVGEVLNGSPSGLRRTVRTTQPTTLLPLILPPDIFKRLARPW